MKIYSVFEPPPRAGEAGRVDRYVFVRDGFCWGAFFLGPLWMLWRRLWLAFLFYVVLIAAFEGAFRPIGNSAAGKALVVFLIALLLGFEAASLRRWTLVRRGWRDLGIVVADDAEAAERRFFEAWESGRRTFGNREVPPSSAPAGQAGAANQASGIIGLFPEPGASR